MRGDPAAVPGPTMPASRPGRRPVCRSAVRAVADAAGLGPGGRAGSSSMRRRRRAGPRRWPTGGLAGEPLQYVLGSWPFRHLELVVDRRVLIPRPETEQVVEVALAELALRPAGSAARPADRRAECRDRDLGCAWTSAPGRGPSPCRWPPRAAPSCPAWRSGPPTSRPMPWRWPRENLDGLGQRDPTPPVGSHLVRGRWFEALPADLAGRVDLLVSNPPYVAEADFAGLDPTVREWEPQEALVAGPGSGGVGGMAAIEAIVAGGGPLVAPGRGAGGRDRPRPGRPPRRRRPPGRVRPCAASSATWPAGTGWWWPGGDRGPDPAAPRCRVNGVGGRGPPGRGGGGHPHRHRLRPGGRSIPAPRRWLGCSPSRTGRPRWPSRSWSDGREQVGAVAGRLDRGRRAPGRAVLARTADPGGPADAGFTADLGGPPSAGLTVGLRWPDHPVVRALCRGLAPWPSPAPICTAARRPPRPTRWRRLRRDGRAGRGPRRWDL